MTITVAVDGSSLGNPGPAGWAWVISADEWDAGGWPSATNNIGELTAVLELLRATERAGLAAEPLHILADSQYVINCVTKWLPGWKRRGWKKADGKPVANREILEELDQALQGRSYRFEWVKGHAGHRLNELADDRARAAAEAFQRGAQPKPGPGLQRATGPDLTSATPVAAAPAAPVPAAGPDSTLFDLGRDPLADPHPRVTPGEARDRWEELLSTALLRPVTISGQGGEWLLIEAATGREALANLHRSAGPPTLF